VSQSATGKPKIEIPTKHTKEYRSLTKAASFEHFLQYLIDKNPTNIPRNEHWETYWSLCYPCEIDYEMDFN